MNRNYQDVNRTELNSSFRNLTGSKRIPVPFTCGSVASHTTYSTIILGSWSYNFLGRVGNWIQTFPATLDGYSHNRTVPLSNPFQHPLHNFPLFIKKKIYANEIELTLKLKGHSYDISCLWLFDNCFKGNLTCVLKNPAGFNIGPILNKSFDCVFLKFTICHGT